jgi:hypothetical protein
MKNNSNNSLKYWQLLEQAETLTERSISPSTALQILSVVRLGEKSEYSVAEGQKFLEAYQLMVEQELSIDQLKTMFGAAKIASEVEEITSKKSQNLVEEMGVAMAQLENQLGTQWLELLEMRLNQWSELGLIEAAAHELRTRILKAEAGGISLNSVLLDWEANREAIMQKLLVELQTQKSSRRPHKD